MSLTRYGEYKESSIPWVGEVPAHWHVAPLLGVAIERSESNIGMQEDNLLSLSYGRIIRKDMESNDGLLPESFETYQIVRKDDIILRLTDLQNDKRSLRSALVQKQGIITSAYLALQPTGASSTFLAYLLRAYDLTKVFYSMGGGLRQSMKFSDLKRMPIALPPIDEQTAIAIFLDRETAKIDALIAEQEKLITLLAEKRQATISHAVTRGLHPKAPMKDSGVSWLGDVPEHWTLSKIRYFTTFIGGGTPSRENPKFWNGEIPWVSPKDMKVEQIDAAEECITSAGLESSSTSLISPGKVLVVVRSGILKHTIPVAINTVAISLNQDMKALEFESTTCNVKFFLRWVQGLNDNLLLAWAKQGATVESIEHAYLANTIIPLPPIAEQIAIADSLDQKLANIDELKISAESAITLLKERRSALIAAAVTGQIDVRGLGG